MPQRREALPGRRRCESFTLPWGGLARPHFVTVGFYPDGRPGEVFITGGKSGEAIESIARDGAVMLSMALQHGATIETIAHAITRDGQDQPQTIVGAIVDMMAKEQSANGRRDQAQGMVAGGTEGGIGSSEIDGG